MFTLEQIKLAHSKVKSGADFPAYIKEIKVLGVLGYETYVTDGHTKYWGIDDFEIATPPEYDALEIAEQSDAEQFKADLKAHQQGGTDYITFCKDCAKSGILKWVVDMAGKSCTYYDINGEIALVEVIPE